MTEPKRVVLFDVDGVLVDSLRAHLRVCSDLVLKYDLPIKVPSSDEFRSLVKAGVVISPMRNFFRVVGFTDEQAEKADRYYQERFAIDYYPLPFPGVYNLLSGAFEWARLGIVTSNGADNVARALGRCMDFFERDLVFTHGDGKWKTKTEAIRLAVAQTGANVDDVVYVGDQPSDMAAAKEAGVRFVAAAYGWGLSPGNVQPEAKSADDIIYCLRNEVWSEVKS